MDLNTAFLIVVSLSTCIARPTEYGGPVFPWNLQPQKKNHLVPPVFPWNLMLKKRKKKGQAEKKRKMSAPGFTNGVRWSSFPGLCVHCWAFVHTILLLYIFLLALSAAPISKGILVLTTLASLTASATKAGGTQVSCACTYYTHKHTNCSKGG